MQFRWQNLISLSLGSLTILIAGLLAGCTSGTPTGDEAEKHKILVSAALQPVLPLPQSTNIFPTITNFTRITTEEGLSDSAVRDILQDNQGYLWFATNEG